MFRHISWSTPSSSSHVLPCFAPEVWQSPRPAGSLWARPCRLIWCPVGGSFGGCGARAVLFEYYSNNIQIPNYSLTSGIKACKGTLLCSKTKYKGIQKDNLFPESPNRVYFLLVPTQYVPSVVEWMIKSLQKVKVRVKTSHLIFG